MNVRSETAVALPERHTLSYGRITVNLVKVNAYNKAVATQTFAIGSWNSADASTTVIVGSSVSS